MNPGVQQELEARDRVQHQLLSAIGRKQHDNRPRLCFKGGTLLRACWEREYRYSEDLDFDWIDGFTEDPKDRVLDFMSRVAAAAQRHYGTEFSVRWGAHTMLIDWASGGNAGTLKVDMNTRPSGLDLNRDATLWHLIDRYDGVSNRIPVLGHTVVSVAASKIECIASPQRAKSRDYYDLVRLLESGEVDFSSAAWTYLQRKDLRTTSPIGESLVHDLTEVTLANLEPISQDYDRSRSAGLITDGPDSFQDLFDRWHDLVSSGAQGLDVALMAQRERTVLEPVGADAGLAEYMAGIARSLSASGSSGTDVRCGRQLPIAKTKCDLRRGHPGACRRLL